MTAGDWLWQLLASIAVAVMVTLAVVWAGSVLLDLLWPARVDERSVAAEAARRELLAEDQRLQHQQKKTSR